MAGNVGRGAARRLWSVSRMGSGRVGRTGNAGNGGVGGAKEAVAKATFSSAGQARREKILGASGGRQSRYSLRVRGEVGCLLSLMPRHDVSAAALLVSKLSSCDVDPDFRGSKADYVSPI